MNRPIRHMAVVVGLMFLALMVNASFTVIYRQGSLAADSRNVRVRDTEFAQDRGQILVGTTAVATTAKVNDPFGFQRSYPEAKLYAQVTGYYSYDYGRTGLESSYNAELAGSAASQTLDRLVDTVTGAVPKGATVTTTLNAKMQEAAAKSMGSYKGAVVALDAKTGAVLALLSTPSYDPNQLASHDLPAARAAWEQLNADANKPLADRASREIYPPGSTFKLVTAAAALENGMTADTMVASPARLTYPNSSAVLTNQVNCGGDQITIDQALQVSCNTAFANLGATVGAEKLRAQAEKFGFGQRQLSDLNGVASRFPGQVDQAQLMQSSIGQYEVAASPLQMAMVAATIANDGIRTAPFVVSEIRSPDLRVLYRHGTDATRALSSGTATAMQQMMVNVVQQGTGTAARVSGVVVGGKTGTAQSDPARPPYAWFVAFSKDPDIAVAVFIENANVDRTDIAGGRLAGPIARAVIEASR